MAALGAGDFKKMASGGPYAGLMRDEIFLEKIKNKKEFIIGTAKGGQAVIGVSYNAKKRTLSYFKKNDIKKNTLQIKATKIFKDKDFGGGGGSGGGAEDTALTESLQCFYCSYVFNKAKKKVLSVSPKQLESTKDCAYTDKSLKDCLDKGPADWVETDVYIKTANLLWVKFGQKVSGKVYFHRGSTFMDNIYKSKTKCHNIDKKSGNPQAPGSFSNDKWNPGDIWMSTLNPSDMPLDNFTSNWGELNDKVAELSGAKNFSDKTKLLGISLKKIGANSPATITYYKVPNSVTKKKYTYNGYKYGKTGNFFSSQDIYIETNSGEIQFRTFGGSTSWQGEIKGTAAAAGKIGGGNVNFYTKQVLGEEFLPQAGEAQLFLEAKKSDYSEKLYDLYKKYNEGQKLDVPLMEFEEFQSKFDTETNLNWKNSKIVCMKFLDVLESSPKNKQDEFINLLYLYGSSDTEQSSYFIKIS